MEQNLPQTISLLSQTPIFLNAWLRHLPDSWTRSNEGAQTWSPFDVVGHLIHGERTDWMPRVRTILDHGENQPFAPFDRLAQERESQGKSLDQLLDEFTSVRSENLRQLRALNITSDQLNLRGRHPALGVVTLSQILATWAVHDLTHIHQISRTMAHQYHEAAGPWQQYLGVLHCSGHGG